MILFLDIESYSEIPIKNGTYAYAEKAETLLIAYALDDGATQIWDVTLGKPMPPTLSYCLKKPDTRFVIHNSMFDRTVLSRSLKIDIPVNRIHDTMVQALSHSLPGGLGKLCEVLQVPVDQAKDKRGRDLIRLFCMPRPKNSVLRRATRETHPVQWKEFVDYARLDVEAMRAVYRKLPNWNYTGNEYDLWQIDQCISDRGVAIDLDLPHAAIATVDKAQAINSKRTQEITSGSVEKTTQRNRLLAYIKETYGIEFSDLTASMVDKALNDENLPESLKELLTIRSEASLSSTAKYKRFLSAVSSDGRLRGMLQFNGASRTGRAAGRIVQLHNLPRPDMEFEDIEIGIRAMKAGCADLLFDNVMSLASNAIRGCIVAAPGKKLVIADLANIEGRLTAWFGNEKWKLHAFSLYDTFVYDDHGNKIPDGKGDFLREGPDLYIVAYSKPFRIDVKLVNKLQRQIGKTMELFLGFGGGPGAFSTGAAALGIDLEDLAAKALLEIPPDILREAKNNYEWAVKEKRTHDLPKHVYIVCESLKRLWRRAHPGITNLWPSVENIVRGAIDSPGKEFIHHNLKAKRDGAWLRVMLPSGRCLCYPSPRVDDKGISYVGVNPYSRQWGRIRTYGGKLVENIAQATARDALMAGVMNAESSDYPVALHVHDEIICEVPDKPAFMAQELCRLMTTGIPWASGLPLAAAGFETHRYRKA